MLSNAYFVAKLRFDTAENEPAKNLQILQQLLPKFAKRTSGLSALLGLGPGGVLLRLLAEGERAFDSVESLLRPARLLRFLLLFPTMAVN